MTSLFRLFLAPVVITSQTHQPVGAPRAYPVHTNHYHTTVLPAAMPQPYSDSTPRYPAAGAPYPTTAPYPTEGNASFPRDASAPYPPAPYPPGPYGQQPYPPVAAAPYPPQAAMDPPAYNEVVGQQNYQKQAPYNPGYSG